MSSLWSSLGDVVSSVTEGVTGIIQTAFEEEDSQEDGDQNLPTAIGAVMAGTTEVGKAMANTSLGLTKGVTSGVISAIGAALSAGSTEEAIGAAADIFTKSVTDELVAGVKELTDGTKIVVKGVRQSVKVCADK